MEYKNADFTADKAKMYESVTEAFAATYHDDTKFFGPVPLTPYPFPGKSKKSLDENQTQERKVWEIQQKNKKEKTDKEYTRAHKKIKEISQ